MTHEKSWAKQYLAFLDRIDKSKRGPFFERIKKILKRICKK